MDVGVKCVYDACVYDVCVYNPGCIYKDSNNHAYIIKVICKTDEAYQWLKQKTHTKNLKNSFVVTFFKSWIM